MGGSGSGRYPRLSEAKKFARQKDNDQRYAKSAKGRLRRKLRRGGLSGMALDAAMKQVSLPASPGDGEWQ